VSGLLTRLARAVRRRVLARVWLRKLFAALETYRPEPVTKRTVVIETIRGYGFYFILALFLGVVLARRGCRVRLLIDDGALAHWDTLRRCDASIETVLAHRAKRRKGAARLRKRCRRIIRRYAAELDLAPLFYSELLAGREAFVDRSRELNEKQLAKGEVSDHALGSHHRFFGGRNFNSSDTNHFSYAQLSIENEAVNVVVAETLADKINPDTLFVLDGIYTTFGPLCEVARHRSISVVLHQPIGSFDVELGERLVSLTSVPYAVGTSAESFRKFVASGRARALRDETKAMLGRRFDAQRRPRGGETARLMEIVREGRARSGRAVGLFPNLTWDCNLPERDTLFAGFGEWLEETVRWAESEGIFLVIREHPQDQEDYDRFGSAVALLEERVPNLATLEYVLVVRGIDRLSSYDLIEQVLDCSVVYNGMLGVEIPILRRPVVFASRSPFSDKELGFTPDTKEEYFALLSNVNPSHAWFCDQAAIFAENAFDAAAYHLIERLYYCPVMPRHMRPVGGIVDYFESWDLSPDKVNPELNPEWARAVDRILGGVDVVAGDRAA